MIVERKKNRAKKNHIEVARIVSHNVYGIYAQRCEVTAIATKLCHRIDSWRQFSVSWSEYIKMCVIICNKNEKVCDTQRQAIFSKKNTDEAFQAEKK